ncbi:MAG: TRAP transporter large permease subunit, partial [Desulfobacteraceae bacterium]|nr:TRAP transporter large permease subunit [Desulfobacteraceae bacterium]
FSAICGSTNATAATMGAATLPEMKRYNYKPELATGVVAAGGSLGILIPPSVVFIVYGILTEQSIGELFVAGLLPGLLLCVLMVASILIWTRMRPDLGPKGEKFTLRQKLASLSGLVETLVIFVLVMGGLFKGIFTPTEAGGIGAFCTLAVALIRRNLNMEGFVQALFAIIAWQSLVYGSVLKASNSVSATLEMPIYPFAYGVAAGCILLCPVLIMDLLLRLRGAETQ